METLQVFIDWGREEQVVRLRSNGEVVVRKVKHTAKAYRELCDWLLEQVEHDASRVEMALERPEGPLVNLGFAYGFDMKAINPKQLSRLRDAYRNSSAKTDETDTEDGLRAMEREPECFRSVSPPTAETHKLRRVTRHRKKLVNQRTGVHNRLQEVVWGYYPAFQGLGSFRTKWMRELWRLIRTPEGARRVRPSRVDRLLKRFQVRVVDADQVLEILRGPELPTVAMVVESSVFEIGQLLDLLDLLDAQIGECERKMDELLGKLEAAQADARPSDVALIDSLPGVGRVVLATLFGEAPALIADRDIDGLRRLGGAAPVTQQTGKQKQTAQRWGGPRPKVTRRLAVNPQLRDAFHHWGEKAMQKSAHYREVYAGCRRRGHSHARACRQIVDQMLTVLNAMLRDGTLYDSKLHGATRLSRSSSRVAGAPDAP